MSTGRIYTASFSAQAETANNDLIEITAPSTDIVVIHEISLSQGTEVGDAQEEMLLIKMISGHTISGSGGASATPRPKNVGDAAAATTVEYTNTTLAGGGTPVEHYNWYWNIRVPFEKIWTPETRPVLAPSRIAVFRLESIPADSITFAGTITFEEIG